MKHDINAIAKSAAQHYTIQALKAHGYTLRIALVSDCGELRVKMVIARNGQSVSFMSDAFVPSFSDSFISEEIIPHVAYAACNFLNIDSLA